MRSWLVVMVSAAVWAAGCTGDPLEEPQVPSDEDEAPRGTVEGGPVGDGAAGDATPAPAAEPDPEPVPVEVPHTWDGQLGLMVCVPSGIRTCLPVEGSANQVRQELGLDGAPVAVNLTLTWEPTPLLTEPMVFGLVAVKDGNLKGLASATGSSPLVLSALDLDAPEAGATLMLVVRAPQHDVEFISTQAHPETPFRVEGSFTVLMEVDET